jgi:hypothetical protein
MAKPLAFSNRSQPSLAHFIKQLKRRKSQKSLSRTPSYLLPADSGCNRSKADQWLILPSSLRDSPGLTEADLKARNAPFQRFILDFI